MATGNSFETDLYALHNYTQNSFISYPKEIFIESLKEFFGDDSYFHYVADPWGHPKVTDHTNQPIEAGLHDDSSTRLFIGEAFRKDASYYPAILVKHGGASSVPIAFTRDKFLVQWGNIVFDDGYGNQKIIKQPLYYMQSGAWEGSIIVEVVTRNAPKARDELVQLVGILFVDKCFDELKDSGVVIKPRPSVGSPSESDDRGDKFYRQAITFEYRFEWRRQIPVRNTIDIINVCFDIGATGKEAPNLTIQFQLPIQ